MIIPFSAVIPTRSRATVLDRVLGGVLAQSAMPAEIIVIDASPDDDTRKVVAEFAARADPLGCRTTWQSAHVAGAAVQRNQGVALATQQTIGFFDDDIIFEPECLARLWRALQSDPRMGGVNAMITNQQYRPPGRASRVLFHVLAGRAHSTYAGRVIGPAVQLLPEDRDDLPDVVATEWLNSTATLYRREALPTPVFDSAFTGYSLMEDLALSLIVGRNWKLANARHARIYHDSQQGAHKSDPVALSKMELVNRYFVMTKVMGRRRPSDHAKLFLWESFQLLAAAIHNRLGREFWSMLAGKIKAVSKIACQRG